MPKKSREDRLIQAWFMRTGEDKSVLDIFDRYIAKLWKPKQILRDAMYALAEKNGDDVPLPRFDVINQETMAVAMEAAAQRAVSLAQQHPPAWIDDIRQMILSGAVVATSDEARQQLEDNLTNLEESLGSEYRSLKFDED